MLIVNSKIEIKNNKYLIECYWFDVDKKMKYNIMCIIILCVEFNINV